jgi:hypothetical protein
LYILLQFQTRCHTCICTWLYCQPKCQLSSSFSKKNVGQLISNYKCCLRNHFKGPWVAIMW